MRAESPGEGHGATFRVAIPGAVRAAPLFEPSRPEVEGKMPPPEPDGPRLPGLRILVVEDEPDASEAVALLLARYGAVVRAAGSVSAAETVLREWVPDVVVTDLGLPRQDGYAMLPLLEEVSRGRDGIIPAIALTAYAQPAERARALAAGFRAHLPKPLDASLLLSTLDAMRTDVEASLVATVAAKPA